MEVITEKRKGVDLTAYHFSFSLTNKIGRILWKGCYWLLFRPFNLDLFRTWRIFLLKIFGATIGKDSNVYASAKIWAPWNLTLGNHSCIGPKVICYNQGEIRIGNHTIISQRSYLCASTHDFTSSNFSLICKPITIKDQVWIAADAFIGPGVSIEEGAVIGARSAVFKKVEAWTVVGGNPAKYLKEREIIQRNQGTGAEK